MYVSLCSVLGKSADQSITFLLKKKNTPNVGTDRKKGRTTNEFNGKIEMDQIEGI